MLARNALYSVKSVSKQRGLGASVRFMADDRSESFNKREKAAEDMYVRKQQEEAIRKLREQLQNQKKKLDKLEEDMKPKK